jgi:hypothetical protein
MCRCPAGSVDHEEQFHEVIAGRKSTLDQENYITPNTFQKSGLYLSVAETLNTDFSLLAAILFTNLLGQFLRSCTGENFGGRLHNENVRRR